MDICLVQYVQQNIVVQLKELEILYISNFRTHFTKQISVLKLCRPYRYAFSNITRQNAAQIYTNFFNVQTNSEMCEIFILVMFF